MIGIVLHVRQGFEDDAGQELTDHLKALSITPTSMKTVTDSALVVAYLNQEDGLTARSGLKYAHLIFARQLLWLDSAVELPKDGDRIAPIATQVSQSVLPWIGANAFSSLHFETADTDDSKELLGFCKSLSRHMEKALNHLKLLPKGKGAAHLPRLHILMTNNREVLVTISDIENSNPWPMGIPRLKFPPQAPSRSTLKLDEAFHVFLSIEQQQKSLAKGMTAVDLGACPGGWTYQLVKRGIYTTAIDNGSIDSKLMSSGLVTHLREDAFTYRPHEMVDWMVCDVVEQPSKITGLMIDWLVHRYCKNTIFNLKLPMKRRYEEIKACLGEIRQQCKSSGLSINLNAKQLYHDRKEITVFISV